MLKCIRADAQDSKGLRFETVLKCICNRVKVYPVFRLDSSQNIDHKQLSDTPSFGLYESLKGIIPYIANGLSPFTLIAAPRPFRTCPGTLADQRSAPHYKVLRTQKIREDFPRTRQLSTLRMAYLSRDIQRQAVLHCVPPLRVKSLAMQSSHAQAKAGSEDQGK